MRQDEVERIVTLPTSGTTGPPKRIYFTIDDQELTRDFFHWGMSTMVGSGDRVLILLPGNLPGSVGDLLKDGLARMDVLGIPHGPVTDPRHTLDVMRQERVTALVGIPVQVLGLARLAAVDRSCRYGGLHSVLLSTDRVPRVVAAAIEETFGCAVYNHYGMTEMGLGGGVDCRARAGYHVREADLLFEIVDPATGRPVPEGESGEVVFTTLTRRAMPLIRYRTGDVSHFIAQACPCGSVLRRMAHIHERLEGGIALRNGTLRQKDLDEALFQLDGLADFRVLFVGGRERATLTLHVKPGEAGRGPTPEAVIVALDTIPSLSARDGARSRLGERLGLGRRRWKHHGHEQEEDRAYQGSDAMNAETTRAALSLLEDGQDFALATILDSQGSSPRHVGTSMLVKKDGSIAGTIGGGPLEAAVINNALEVLVAGRARLMDFDSRQLGMMCGGGGLVLIEHIHSTKPAKELYRGLLDLLEDGDRGWLVTVVQQEGDGIPTAGKCLVRSDGSVAGDPVRPLEALQELAKRGGTYDQILAGGDPSRAFVQSVGARGKAYVFGAGHCGEKLVPVLSTIGFFTAVVDDRGDFANRERFPMADRIVVPESFDGVVDTLPIDEDSYIVIATRGHAHDRNVLEQALRTRAGYVGMMGSKKKVAEIFQALREEGFSPDDIARVHAPIGLVIGAETPEEIAISIAAELVQVRAKRE